MDFGVRAFEKHGKIGKEEFIEMVINQYPQPENIPKQLREMIIYDCYKFKFIYENIFKMLKDKIEDDEFDEFVELPDNKREYNNNYNYMTENNKYIKLLIFLKNKTPKLLLKYVNKFYDDSVYYFIITSYLVYYNGSIKSYMEKKLEKSLLPKSLQKMRNYRFESDIMGYIFFRLNGVRIGYYVEQFLLMNLNKATIKDCRTFKSKLKKEHPKNIKRLEKLEIEKEEILNSYEEPDFQYVLDEINNSIEGIKQETDNFDLILECINIYIDYIKTH